MREPILQIVAFEALQGWAKTYVKNLQAGACVCLTGPLGAGKTAFTRSIVTELGMDSEASFGSTTFSVMNIYDAGALRLRHFDLYRLETFAGFEDLDLMGELKCPDGISFVEWGDKFSELKKQFTHFIKLDFIPESEVERFVYTWLA